MNIVNELKVVEFVNIYEGDGGEIFVSEIVVSENMGDERFKLYGIFGLGGDKMCLIDDEEDGFKNSFDYNGKLYCEGLYGDGWKDVLNSYKSEWMCKKGEFLSKRLNNEKLFDCSVEYDVSMGFVLNNKIDEVVDVLKKLLLIDEENGII